VTLKKSEAGLQLEPGTS